MAEGSSTSDEINTRMEQALAYQARGWRVIQLHGINAKTGVGCTCRLGPECRSAGKHPVVDAWQKQPPMTEAEIREAWSGWRTHFNVGIATGAESGFWILDIDPDNGGMESAAKLKATYGDFAGTRVVRTGSGGYHYAYLMPDFPVGNGRRGFKPYPGIDIRGEGGQVVAPPSVTDKGEYVVLSDQPIGPAPDWILDLLRPEEPKVPSVAEVASTPVDTGDPRLAAYAQRAWDGEVARLVAMAEAAVPEGVQYIGEPWDATTFEVACNLLELANAPWTSYQPLDAYQAVKDHAPRDTRFTDDDVEKKIASAQEKVGDRARPAPALAAQESAFDWDIPNDYDKIEAAPAAARRSWPMRSWDDLGNAKRMVDHYSDRLRYVPGVKLWTMYDGGRWATVDSSVVQSLFLALTDSETGILARTEALEYDDTPGQDANGNPTPSDRERFMLWVGKQRMNARIVAALSVTQGMTAIHAALEDFDADPMLLNVANGVIDLRTGDLRPHDPDLMLMKQSSVHFDPLAPCHGWQAFLDRVMPDQQMQIYLQRIVGYSLTGSMSEQAFFIHHGAGANGKSVFLQVMRAALGEYGQSVPRETLLAKKNSEHPTSVARMAGMRFLEVSETAPGKRLDEEMVKGLTGGEKQTARLMGKDFFDFTPTGKIHYVTNHLPRLSDANSIWRRLHLVRWGVTIPEKERNLNLAEELIEAEIVGILAWAVRGTQMWLASRLSPPEAAGREIEAYREDMDAFGDFLRMHTREEDGALAKTEALYSAYRGWTFSAGISKPMSQQAFTAVLKERGYEYTRRATGRFFKGLVVTTTQEAPSPWHE